MPEPAPVRVVLIDDHPIFLQGLQLLLKGAPDVEVVSPISGRLVFRAALPGTSDRNDMYLRGKRKVVELHGRPSLYERMLYIEQGTTFEDATELAFPEYAAHGGGVPMLSADGELLGMVIVSGLPMVQDHELAVAAIRAVARGS